MTNLGRPAPPAAGMSRKIQTRIPGTAATATIGLPRVSGGGPGPSGGPPREDDSSGHGPSGGSDESDDLDWHPGSGGSAAPAVPEVRAAVRAVPAAAQVAALGSSGWLVRWFVRFERFRVARMVPMTWDPARRGLPVARAAGRPILLTTIDILFRFYRRRSESS